MSADLGEWEAPAEVTQAAPPEKPALLFGDVDEFVREFVIHHYRRRVGPRSAHRWAADWWHYQEAALRLDCLWRSFEFHRHEPATGLAVWLRDFFDPHMRELTSPDGPFCESKDTSSPLEPLPYEPPPEGLYDEIAFPA